MSVKEGRRKAVSVLLDRAEEHGETLSNRLLKNKRRLKSWLEEEGITCYRLYDRDVPEIPLAIDWYEGRLYIAEFESTLVRDLNTGEHRLWLGALVEASARALGVSPEMTFVKRRQRQRGKSQYEKQATTSARFVVREGGLRFWVNLSDYLDTGLFLDHRVTRARVAAEAEGRRVLNLFAYTGSFTVYAAARGARKTTTVDLSRTYLDWTRENLALNGLDTRVEGRNRVIQADALDLLEEEGGGERYDLIILDPPTFSNSKRMSRGHFDVREHHGKLLAACLGRLDHGGVLYFSTNSRRFELDRGALGAAAVEDISEETIPKDFRDQRIHRCYRITRQRRRVVASKPKKRRKV